MVPRPKTTRAIGMIGFTVKVARAKMMRLKNAKVVNKLM